MRRNLVHHHRVGARLGAAADLHGSDDFRACADENIASELRALSPFRADSDLVFDKDVAAAANTSVNNHARGVDQNKTRPELRAAADDAVTAIAFNLLQSSPTETNDGGATTASTGTKPLQPFHQ